MKKKKNKKNSDTIVELLIKLFRNPMFIEFLSLIWLVAAIFTGLIVYVTYSLYIQYGFVWNTIQGILLSTILIAILLYLFSLLLSTQKGD